nr:uncharacterized protein LOC125643091 isoform X2 [Caretta caretta]
MTGLEMGAALAFLGTPKSQGQEPHSHGGVAGSGREGSWWGAQKTPGRAGGRLLGVGPPKPGRCKEVGVKQKQAEVTRILDINKTKYELIDVSLSEQLLQEMRAKAGL